MIKSSLDLSTKTCLNKLTFLPYCLTPFFIISFAMLYASFGFMVNPDGRFEAKIVIKNSEKVLSLKFSISFFKETL